MNTLKRISEMAAYVFLTLILMIGALIIIAESVASDNVDLAQFNHACQYPEKPANLEIHRKHMNLLCDGENPYTLIYQRGEK